jgi:iron-sulfur cluster repair protein YtfE (RIC family)
MPITIAHPVIAAERPLELLFACHEKVRYFTALSGRLAEHVTAQGADAEARQAATNILRYFELSLPHHHADEEEDVFPALAELRDPALDRAMAALLDEHQFLDGVWQEVREWLKLIEGGDTAAATQSPARLAHFIADYPLHAEREEREVFPALTRLPESRINAIAARMRARRGA